MGFWCSLLVELIGGIVTALVLGAGAAWFAASQQVRTHGERIADLVEDNRRWFRDRDARVRLDAATLTGGHAARNITGSSIAVGDHMSVRRDALHEYRDELTAKRRRYRELCGAEGWTHARLRRRRGTPFPRLELTDEQRGILASWRVFTPPGSDTPVEVINDPSSDEREPDLRRFEREGDGCE